MRAEVMQIVQSSNFITFNTWLSLSGTERRNLQRRVTSELSLVKGAVSRNSAKLGNYKMPVKLRET